jgi:hypothetical protein
MRLFCIGIVLIVLISQSSCYNSKDEFYNNITPATSKPAEGISISDINENDTVTVRFVDLELLFQKFSDTLKVIESVIWINDTLFCKNYGLPYRVMLPLNEFSEGANSVTINYKVATGTGSVADIASDETFEYNKHFNVIRVPQKTAPISLISYKIVDGRLDVLFTPYLYKDFNSYIIFKYVNGYYNENLKNTIIQPKETKFIDSLIVEGIDMTYYIYLRASNTQIERLVIPIKYPLPELTFKSNQSQLTIKWKKSKFYNNFGKYEIRTTSGLYLNQPPFKYETSDINDTTLIINDMPFGGRKVIEYRFTSKKNGEGGCWNQSEFTIGEEVPEWDLFSPNVERIYNAKQKEIGFIKTVPSQTDFYKMEKRIQFYDILSNKLTESVLIENSMYNLFNSSDGDILGSYDEEKIIIFKANNKATSQSIFLKQVLVNYFSQVELNDNNFKISASAVDNAGNLYIYFTYYEAKTGTSQYRIMKYNYNTATKIMYEIDPSFVFKRYVGNKPFQISYDGSYCIFKNQLFKLNDNKIEYLKDILNSRFMPNANTYIQQNNTKTVTINNCSDGQIISKYNSSNYIYLISDNCKKILEMTEDCNYLNIIDIATGTNQFRLHIDSQTRFHTITGEYIYDDSNRRLNTDIDIN